MSPAEDCKQAEAMQQSPSAPPMGPPPSYAEAIQSSPYPAAAAAAATAATSQSAAYPIADPAMPLPQPPAPTAPYPVDDSAIPQPMSAPLQHAHAYAQPMGFSNSAPAQHAYQQPIVSQPAAYNDEYVHPKTTYVVLQDDRHQRRNDDGECGCTDWLMCCWCCVETFRCMVLCFECADACK